MSDDERWKDILEGLPGKDILRELEGKRLLTGMQISPSTARQDTGTTILAFRYKEGIFCAADTQISTGDGRITGQGFDKIYSVSETTALLGAGSVSSLQLVVKYMRAVNQAFLEKSGGYFISVKGQANYLSRLCRVFLMTQGPFFSLNSILCGLEKKGEPKIYCVGMDGAIVPMPDFYTTGSGGPNVRPILGREWKEGMNFEQASHLALAALAESGEIDAWTSKLAVTVPRLAVVTPGTKFAFVRENVVADIAVEVLLEKGLDRSPIWQAIQRRNTAEAHKKPKRQKKEKKGGAQ